MVTLPAEGDERDIPTIDCRLDGSGARRSTVTAVVPKFGVAPVQPYASRNSWIMSATEL